MDRFVESGYIHHLNKVVLRKAIEPIHPSVWDTNPYIERIKDFFPERRHKHAVQRLIDLVDPKLRNRYQLGLHPLVEYKDAETMVIQPANYEQSSKNTRALHTYYGIYQGLACLAEAGTQDDNKLLWVYAFGIHDYDHPPMSHGGDRFLEKTENYARAYNSRLYDVMAKNNLIGDHDEREVRLVLEPEWGLTDFLDDNLKPFGLERHELAILVGENGPHPLLALKQIMDPLSYLVMDSRWYGYEPPLSLASRIINSAHQNDIGISFDPEAVRDLLGYRGVFHRTHYSHPWARLLEDLRIQVLFEDIVKRDERTPDKTTQPAIVTFKNRSDKEILEWAIPRSFVAQTPAHLGMLGLVPEGTLIGRGPMGKIGFDQFMYRGIRPTKKISIYDPVKDSYLTIETPDSEVHTEIGRVLSNESSDITLTVPDSCFWETARIPLDQHLITKGVYSRRVNSAEIERFFSTCYGQEGRLRVRSLTRDQIAYKKEISEIFQQGLKAKYTVPNIA